MKLMSSNTFPTLTLFDKICSYCVLPLDGKINGFGWPLKTVLFHFFLFDPGRMVSFFSLPLLSTLRYIFIVSSLEGRGLLFSFLSFLCDISKLKSACKFRHRCLYIWGSSHFKTQLTAKCNKLPFSLP